jgi:hypothetical protein
MRGRGILDAVVQEGRLDGLGVQMKLLRHDLRHRQRMRDIGRAVLAQLSLMRLLRKDKGGMDRFPVCGRIVGTNRRF